jgi:quercetin dioxygenase-like cupin family protein
VAIHPNDEVAYVTNGISGSVSVVNLAQGRSWYIEPTGTMVPRVKNERSIMLRKKILMVVLLFLMAGTLMAQEPKVTSLMSKDLTENPGREVLMITVEHAPGGSSPIHRHNAHAMVYVLEGSVVMQLKGGKQVTLTPGQTFYEGPDDIHIVDRNASSTQPAKFLVFLIKDKGAPALVPVK